MQDLAISWDALHGVPMGQDAQEQQSGAGASSSRVGELSAPSSGSWRWSTTLVQAPRLPQQHPGGDVPWVPGPRATAGVSTWGHGGANQGLSPKWSHPCKTRGAAAIPILPPRTAPPCHGSSLNQGILMLGTVGTCPCPLPGHRQGSAMTNLSPKPLVKDNRGTIMSTARV